MWTLKSSKSHEQKPQNPSHHPPNFCIPHAIHAKTCNLVLLSCGFVRCGCGWFVCELKFCVHTQQRRNAVYKILRASPKIMYATTDMRERKAMRALLCRHKRHHTHISSRCRRARVSPAAPVHTMAARPPMHTARRIQLFVQNCQAAHQVRNDGEDVCEQ